MKTYDELNTGEVFHLIDRPFELYIKTLKACVVIQGQRTGFGYTFSNLTNVQVVYINIQTLNA